MSRFTRRDRFGSLNDCQLRLPHAGADVVVEEPFLDLSDVSALPFCWFW